jgi:hypothetical protein
MMHYMQTIALLEMSLTCATLIILLAQSVFQAELPVLVRILLALLFGNLFFWPLGLSMELPLAGYVRGVTGDLSVVTMLLLWSSALLPAKQIPLGFKLTVLVVAFAFYPLALGLGMADPYAWGYSSIALLVGVLILALVCGLAGWIKGVWILAFAVLAWSMQWHESGNLWDYVLDPFLALWALMSIVSAWNNKRREKARSGFLFRAG